MVELLIVSGMSQEHRTRATTVKTQCLGYARAALITEVAPGGRLTHVVAPWGAVKSREDAERLIAALEAEFPGVSFTVDTRRYDRAHEVVWHAG